MKKVFCLVFGLLLLEGIALADDGFIKSSAQLTDAPELFKALEQNKFTFKKNYWDKKILVAGTVEKVGEGPTNSWMPNPRNCRKSFTRACSMRFWKAHSAVLTSLKSIRATFSMASAPE